MERDDGLTPREPVPGVDRCGTMLSLSAAKEGAALPLCAAATAER